MNSNEKDGPSYNSLYPLVFKKEDCKKCLICGIQANFACSKCKTTNYCCTEHVNLDYEAIHKYICEMIICMKQYDVFVTSKDERMTIKKRMDEIKQNIITIASERTLINIYKDLFDNAASAAMQYFKFSTEVYGPYSIELIKPLALLAHSLIEVNKIDDAKEYLNQAQWISLNNKSELKHPQISAVNRVYGKYFCAIKSHKKALESASLDYGPKSIEMATGLYYLASTYVNIHKHLTDNPDDNPAVENEKEKKVVLWNDIDVLSKADYLYDQVAYLWAFTIASYLKVRVDEPERYRKEKQTLFSETQLAMSHKILLEIKYYYRKRTVVDRIMNIATSIGRPNAQALSDLSLALFHTLIGEYEKARYLVKDAESRMIERSDSFLESYIVLIQEFIENYEIPKSTV